MATFYRLDRALIRVAGPDAHGFLNNLLTQELGDPWTENVAYTALLSPQGKVITDMFVWRDADGVVLDVAPERAPELMRRLSMYKLRANVAINEDTRRAAAWCADAEDIGAPDPRIAALGLRRLVSVDEPLPDGEAAFDAHRLALGAPDLARDAALEEVFALEALLEELNGVAFDKGCFVGQENVSRMKRRATTRRKFCPIAYEGEAPPYGAPIKAGAAELGSVRTGAAGRAIALLRLDRALDAAKAGIALEAAGREVRLAPPSWLVLPADAGEGN